MIQEFTKLSKAEFSKENYVVAFSLACQALDAASKSIYPKLLSGERFKKAINDNFALFCAKGLPGISCTDIIFSNEFLKKELELNNDTAPLREIIYKTVRCSLIHECKLPKCIKLTKKILVGSKNGSFYLPVSIILGLLEIVNKLENEQVV